jgi:hypothetical protein
MKRSSCVATGRLYCSELFLFICWVGWLPCLTRLSGGRDADAPAKISPAHSLTCDSAHDLFAKFQCQAPPLLYLITVFRTPYLCPLHASSPRCIASPLLIKQGMLSTLDLGPIVICIVHLHGPSPLHTETWSTTKILIPARFRLCRTTLPLLAPGTKNHQACHCGLFSTCH